MVYHDINTDPLLNHKHVNRFYQIGTVDIGKRIENEETERDFTSNEGPLDSQMKLSVNMPDKMSHKGIPPDVKGRNVQLFYDNTSEEDSIDAEPHKFVDIDGKSPDERCKSDSTMYNIKMANRRRSFGDYADHDADGLEEGDVKRSHCVEEKSVFFKNMYGQMNYPIPKVWRQNDWSDTPVDTISTIWNTDDERLTSNPLKGKLNYPILKVWRQSDWSYTHVNTISTLWNTDEEWLTSNPLKVALRRRRAKNKSRGQAGEEKSQQKNGSTKKKKVPTASLR